MTGGKRIDALKNAANAFIDEIATQNASISDASKQHQVSIVKFAGEKSNKVGNDTYRKGGYTYNYSQVMKSMTACSETTKSSFKDSINAIKPAGATNAAAGMELAHGQTSKRSDAKKIVIFFTDGTPTTQSEFSNGVASDAIAAAKTMKDAGASVYTIGIFKDANPKADVNTASNENKFMRLRATTLQLPIPIRKACGVACGSGVSAIALKVPTFISLLRALASSRKSSKTSLRKS